MTLVETIQRCALTHRRGERMAASELLVEIIDGLQSVMALEQSSVRHERFGAIIETITAAQQRGDVIAIADALEYELAPLLA